MHWNFTAYNVSGYVVFMSCISLFEQKMGISHVNLLRNSKYRKMQNKKLRIWQFLCSVSEIVLSWKKLTRKLLEEKLWQNEIRVTAPFLTHFLLVIYENSFPVFLSKEKASTNCFHITFQCLKNVMPETYPEPCQTSKMELFIYIFIINLQ